MKRNIPRETLDESSQKYLEEIAGVTSDEIPKLLPKIQEKLIKKPWEELK